MTIKNKRNWIFSIAGLCIVLLLLILPVAAYTLAEIELVTEKRPYDSNNPAKKVLSDKFTIPMNGQFIVTFKIDPWYPYTMGWGRDGDSPFFLGPTVESSRTSEEPVANQPFEERYVIQVNTNQYDNLFLGRLSAPTECVSFQNCYEGTQFAAKQSVKFEFNPTDVPTPPVDPEYCSGLSGTVYNGYNYEYNDYGTPTPADSICECAQLCNDDDECKVVTYWYGDCYLKNELDFTPVEGPAEANAASWVKGEIPVEEKIPEEDVIPEENPDNEYCPELWWGTVYDGINFEWNDYGTPTPADSICECAQLCNDDDECKVVTYWYGDCYLKNDLDSTPVEGPAEANAASWVKGEI